MALTDNVLGVWSFDSNASDSVGSNNGSVSGATLDTSNQLLGAGCYDFDGVNDYISFSSFGSVKSFSMWIKPDTTVTVSGGATGLVEFNGNYNAIYLGNFTGSFANELITFATSGGSGEYWYWTTTDMGVASITNSAWHNIFIVWESFFSSYRLYYDGVDCGLANSYGSPTEATFTAPYLGRRGTSYFPGLIDELVTWSDAKTSTDATNLWNSGTGLAYPFGGTPSITDNAIFMSINY